MTNQEMQQELERLRAENAALKSGANNKTNMRVSEAGYVDIFGLPGKGRFAISLTPSGWDKLFAMTNEIKTYVEANRNTCEARNREFVGAKRANA